MAEEKVISSSCRLYFLSCLRKYNPGSLEIVDLRNLKVSTADTVLSRMVKGVSGGYSLVQCHLHNLEGIQVQVVLTSPLDHLFHFLSVCRLITSHGSAQ